MDRDDWLRLLRPFLEQVPTLSLATVDAEGWPHAADLNFVADGELRLYWISRPDSLHSLHVAERPRVAATIHAPFQSPREIRGLQLHGRCAAAPQPFEMLWTRFCAKFPYAQGMEERARAERFYCLQPTWMRWIDNRDRFGEKRETRWSDL